MNYSPLVAACLAFLLLAQTIAFGIAARTLCYGALDFPIQTSYTPRIINNPGPFHVSLNDRCLRNPLEC